MWFSRRITVAIACLLTLVLLACGEEYKAKVQEAKNKTQALHTALAFYMAINDPTPEMERAMEVTGYRMYGYPTFLVEMLGTWVAGGGIQKQQGTSDAFEAEIPFWLSGTNAAGNEKKMRQTLVVRVTPDSASPKGWTVSQFQLKDREDLTIVRQSFIWLLWMFFSPFAFLILLLLFGGWAWQNMAYLVASLMVVPLRIYMSYVFFGTALSAGVAMVVWFMIEVSFARLARS